MEITVLYEFFNVIIIGICLCIGYVIKHSLNFIPNKYIPLIMLCLGTFINIILNINNITGEVILSGMISGLASTGLYEAFKNLIKKGGEK